MKKKMMILLFIILFAAFFSLLFVNPHDYSKQVLSKPEKNHSVLNLSNFEGYDPGFEELIKNIPEKIPNLKVKVNTYSKDIYYNIIKSSISSGIGPDLFELDNINILNSYITENSLLSLNNFITFDDLPFELREYACMLNNRIYATPPLSKKAFVILYNKEIFNKLGIKEGPKSEKQLVEDCMSISKNGYTPIAFGIKDNECLKNLITQLGAYSESGTLLFFYSPKAFDNLTKRITSFKGYFPKNYFDMDYSDAKQMFINGKAAIFFGMDNQEHEFSTRSSFRVGSTFLYNNFSYKSFCNYSGSYAVNINTPDKIGAIEFVKYISNKATIRKYNDTNLHYGYALYPDILLPQYTNKYMLNWIYRFKSKDLLMLDEYFDKLQYELIK